ncbi:hypothetical protein GCM10028792_37780 [Salinisphaera aquimarina]
MPGHAALGCAQVLGIPRRPSIAFDAIQLEQIEPGKPNQNAYIESLNGRLRDECLNEHWFVSLAHASSIIRGWHREYNEERPKKELRGLTPADYAAQIITNTAI